MKHCSRHMSDLARAIRKKGMGHMITQSDVDIARKTQLWFQGALTAEEFDPLLVSILEINAKAVDLLGTRLLEKKANGNEHCPLCSANQILKSTRMDISWIDNITDMMVIVALSNGLELRRLQ